MSSLRVFHIDAFTNRLFGGNPAAIVPLEQWLDEGTMQAMAQENNLSETAFFVPVDEGGFHLRWFTPWVEVKLCGHATLASAFVVFNELEPGRREVRFDTLSGALRVARDGDRLSMDFPAWTLEHLDEAPAALHEGLGVEPEALFSVSTKDNLFAVLRDEAQVRAVEPNGQRLTELHPAGVVITAPGDRSDCASRYFAPSYGIPEDPGTGSIHCGLAPYWSGRLGKTSIFARQVSSREAELFCEVRGERVAIAGQAVKYSEGRVFV